MFVQKVFSEIPVGNSAFINALKREGEKVGEMNLRGHTEQRWTRFSSLDSRLKASMSSKCSSSTCFSIEVSSKLKRKNFQNCEEKRWNLQ